MTHYKDYRIVDGKPKWLIVDETGKTINRDPDLKVLKGLIQYSGKKRYNEKNTCERCGIDFGNEWSNKPLRESIDGQLTGKWICGYCRDGEYKKANKEFRSKIKSPISYYNKTNICDNIKENNEKCKNKLSKGNVFREYNKEENWTGNWICRSCYNYKYHRSPGCGNELIKSMVDRREKNKCILCKELLQIGNPEKIYRKYNEKGSWLGYICYLCYMKEYYEKYESNLWKSITDSRTGNLDPNSTKAKGDNFEELTSIWKGVKILSKENDNYIGPLDHSIDSEGKIPQTTGKWYDPYNRFWVFARLDREWDKIFDYEICYCASKDGKNIERIYEIPKLEITTTSITIYNNDNYHWYDKYRITDENELKKVNEIWKKICEA